MNIIVFVKQVPDTTGVKINPKTGSLIREGLKSIINPDDLHALQAAVSIKETCGGQITAVSMGPAQAIDALTEALGMGADKGVLLTDTAFAGADTWATSFVLGKAVEKIAEFDLIICGRQAIDGDTAQIGPQIADYLDIPQVTYVSEIQNIESADITVKRRLEEGYEIIKARIPALITVIGEINTPQYPNIGKIIQACTEKAPIQIWNAADIGVKTTEIGLQGSLTHVIKTFSPKTKRQTETLQGTKEEIAASLVEKLSETGAMAG